MKKGKTQTEVSTAVSDLPLSRIADLKIRNAVKRLLEEHDFKPKSNKSIDLVPMLEEIVGEIPEKYCDDIQNAYQYSVFTLIDSGEFSPPKSTVDVWLEEPGPRFVKGLMDRAKNKRANGDDND